MVLATTAAVRALWAQDDYPMDADRWIWSLQLEIPAKFVKSSPVLTKKLLTALLEAEPGAQIRSAADHSPIDVSNAFPSTTFAKTFAATPKQQNLLLHFELLSARSFHKSRIPRKPGTFYNRIGFTSKNSMAALPVPSRSRTLASGSA